MRIALCQIPVSADPVVNLSRARDALLEAAADGAELAVFPEATMVRFGADLRAAAEPLDGPFCAGLAAACASAGVAAVAGVFEPSADGRVHNTAVAFSAAALVSPALAIAQTSPDQPLPNETIKGTIVSWTSDETLWLSDDRGYNDAVSVGEQTAIAPGRSALVPGARVTIRGYNGGRWFDALQINVTGAGTAVAPYLAYPYAYGYPYAYAYAYPYAYGYPYGYWYGPAFSVNLGFRFGGGWGGGWGGRGGWRR